MTPHLRAATAAVSLLLLGFVIGRATDHIALAHGNQLAAAESSHEERFMAFLEGLDLSPVQREAIHEALSTHQANVQRAWEAMQPQLTATMDSARVAIETHLSEAQVTALHDWLRAEHERAGVLSHPVLSH